jgi:ABC-2 type transport system ATP-binding protein
MINRGRKVLDGKLGEVKSRFGANTIQVEMEGDGAFTAELPGVQKMTEFNNYVELQLEDGADSGAILKAMAERVTVRRFQLVEPSLYDIFINVAQVDPEDVELRRGEGVA